ncbi:penicillin-binding transpeptidase domain-containing protein [Hahella sp. SMD15-11]|uniref:Penicillin-binding transpeptidase domain-containing protein n=1 Tax=Thermohahella caldifontis TaxID=3142973 RepID=A0AB39V0K2_9GAMM
MEPISDQEAALAQVPQVQGALVSLNPTDGAMLAVVGGFDFAQSKYNRAIQAARQPGSNFKPFVYLTALEQGMTAATLVNDAPIVFNDAKLETAWRPENSSGKFLGPTRLRKALYQSRNLVSIRLLQKMGIDTLIDALERFGFDTSRFPRDLSLALGSAALTPLEVARGYAMLANGGYSVTPWLIDRVESQTGTVVYREPHVQACEPPECLPESLPEPVRPAKRVADERALYILNSMLQDVIRKGTGRKARALGRRDLAGKTGTTNDQVDAWFSGYGDHVVTSVWVGYDEPQSLGRREYGARAALPIWMDYMKEALRGVPEYIRPQPPGIVSIRIDARTGKPADAWTENVLFEYFREEYAPTADSNPGSTDNATTEAPDQVPAELLF